MPLVKTIVALSGGIDSAVVLAGCIQSGDECAAIGFDYGQPHGIELSAAATIAAHYSVPFEVQALPSMLLVDPVVFAGRNLMFAATAVSLAQQRGFDRVAFGCNASDWARFPDCRPAFWRALDAAVFTAYGVEIVTPLIHVAKRDVVKAARELGVPLAMTWSCYDPHDGKPCGECLACEVRTDAVQAVEVVM